MSIIKSINAIEVLDSRGNPTVCVNIVTADGSSAYATVPSGASTGSKEALELRDGGHRYGGKGVLQAINNINQTISPLLIGKDSKDQANIDEIMLKEDGTDNKENLGANATLAVSLANARVAAKSSKMPLYQWIAKLNGNTEFSIPVPMMNIINGGQHADNKIDVQEFMIQPSGFENFSSALRAGVEIFHNLKTKLNKKGMMTSVGDEGGFAPNLDSTNDAIEIILDAIVGAGYEPEKQVSIALDMAASEFYIDGKYCLAGENKNLSSEEMVDFIFDLTNKFPISSIEDPMHEEDWDGWDKLTKKLSGKIQLVGDDLFVTNPKILQEGIDKSIANSILIKLNQIGTLSETLECINLATKNNYSTIISHRSGESSDTFIADLAVATNSGQIKTGSLCRSDRVEKYNRLSWIVNELGDKIKYAKLK